MLISADQALEIAQADAVHAYRGLSSYRVRVTLEEDGWHVDYELKNPCAKGGDPHYVIDRFSGDFVSKRYDQ